ncbi:MAG: class I SAM-dependent methyltransferase [Lachnospiraceae bacterium]|nr:class I SAM-dependent methyltransferase [Lachnospiraceae bacterium]
MEKVSMFDRTLRNESVLGAYYTDPMHARWLGKLFRCPDRGTVSILEPSFGDGRALQAFVEGLDTGDCRVSTFGVEINREAYESGKKRLDYSLNADFLDGIRVSNNAFGACFSNPPYGWFGSGQKNRLESKFVEKIGKYLKKEGILVLIVSAGTLQIESFAKTLLARFEILGVYRFHEPEYEKWKQAAVIARKKDSFGFFRKDLERFLSKETGTLPLVPEECLGEKIVVPESDPDKVETFTTVDFMPETAVEFMKGSPLFGVIREKAFLPEYVPMQIGSPPLPLKKDLLYLTAIAGGGAGLAGKEGVDLHLQRGVVKRIKSSRLEQKGDKIIEVETESSQISMNIINDEGDVFRLE